MRLFRRDDRMLVLERQASGFSVREEAFNAVPRVEFRSGAISGSLYAATDAARVPDGIASQMAQIFASQIDFHAGLHRGDSFSVAYEAYYRDGQLLRVGRVLAAQITHDGVNREAVYFESGPNHGDYYTPQGKALRETFLRFPLEYSRVTSGLTMERFIA